MDLNSYTRDLLDIIKELADPHSAPKMKRYMKNQFEFIGVVSRKRAIAIKKVTFKHGKVTQNEVIPLMNMLWTMPQREMQYLGMDLSKKFSNKFNAKDLPKIKELIVEKSWWDTVDFLASNHLGGALYNAPDKGKSYATSLIQSDNLWLRRSALLFQLKFKEETNFELLKELILKTIQEQDFFIRKAHGWALRQYSKFDKAAVKEFIVAYRNKLSNLAIKEGSKYL